MFIHDHMYRGVHSDVYTVTIEFVVRKNLHLDCAIKVIFIVLRSFCHKRLIGVGQTAFGVRDGPLEKLWGKGGREFSSRRNVFSLSNSLYEFFLGYSINIF